MNDNDFDDKTSDSDVRDTEVWLRASMQHHADAMPTALKPAKRKGRPVFATIAAAASLALVLGGATYIALRESVSTGSSTLSSTLPVPSNSPSTSTDAESSQPVPTVVSSGDQLFPGVYVDDCLDTLASPPPPMEHLPADLEFSEAYICLRGTEMVPNYGTYATTTLNHITGGLDAVLAAYAEPDREASGDGGCPAIAYILIPILFLTPDGIVAVRPPLDACGTPMGQDAFNALQYKKVGSKRGQLIESSLSLSSGCSDQFKDLLAMDGTPASWATITAIPSKKNLTLCIYSSDGDAGNLIAAQDLSATDIASIDAHLNGSGTCDVGAHTSFATIVDRGSWVAMAIDGCGVTADGDGTNPGTPELTAILTDIAARP